MCCFCSILNGRVPTAASPPAAVENCLRIRSWVQIPHVSSELSVVGIYMRFPINVITRALLPFVKGYSSVHMDFHTNLHDIMFNKANRNQGDHLFKKTKSCRTLEWYLSISDVMFKCGLVDSNKVHLVQREDLVASYVGATAPKTVNHLRRAEGATLFIDEAYRLAPPVSQNDYGAEALETIMATIEGGTATTSDRPAIIMAGYPHEMDRLVALNQGLKRRITHVFQFEDYSPREIYCIFKSMCQKNGFVFSDDVCDDDVITRIASCQDLLPENGGFSAMLMDAARSVQDARLTSLMLRDIMPKKEALMTLFMSDIMGGVDRLRH